MGFTLVEVLLALALTVVLVGAIYTATTIYQRMTTAGRDEVERSQIIRAVHRKMAADIRSVVFNLPEEEGQSQGGGTEGEAAAEEGSTEIEILSPTENIAGTAKGIVGDEFSLVLHVSRPPRGMAYSTQENPTVSARRSDLVSITYLLASDAGGALHSAVANTSGQTGLARLVGDRLTMDTLDTAGQTDALASTATVLAPEVQSLMFAYWDGTVWQPNWDSTQLGALPRAIRVTLGLRQMNSDGTASDQLKEHSFIINVPISDPTPPEALELGF